MLAVGHTAKHLTNMDNDFVIGILSLVSYLPDIWGISTHSSVCWEGQNTRGGIIQVPVERAAVRKELWLVDLGGSHLDNC